MKRLELLNEKMGLKMKIEPEKLFSIVSDESTKGAIGSFSLAMFLKKLGVLEANSRILDYVQTLVDAEKLSKTLGADLNLRSSLNQVRKLMYLDTKDVLVKEMPDMDMDRLHKAFNIDRK